MISDEAVDAASREPCVGRIRAADDAVVNALTFRRHERAIEAVLEVCDEMDVGAQWKSDDPKSESVAARSIRAVIAHELMQQL